MATQLIAEGSNAATSEDIVLTDGATATVAMKGAARDAGLIIEMKDDASAWNAVGFLTTREPGQVITGPGTFRVRREANSGIVGAFRG